MIIKYWKLILVLLSSCLFYSCSPNPEQVLRDTKVKLKNAVQINLQSTYYWPDMIGEIDTTTNQISILIDDSPVSGYSFVASNDQYDAVYQNGNYQVFNHSKKSVKFTSNESIRKNPGLLNSTILVQFGPLGFIREDGWIYEKDTTIDNIRLLKYGLIVIDSIYDNTRVRLERKVYLNPNELVVFQQEQLGFQEDTLGQKIVFKFEDYHFNNDDKLTYSLPEGYVTRTEREYLKKPKVGDIAPDFNATTASGDSILLKSLRGRKVLLNFSIINCGFCMQALKHINRSPKNFNENVTALYINPIDSIGRMTKYMNKTSIPFPVIIDQYGIAEKYGVDGYPFFFLIDEDGNIEDIQGGYSKEFIDRFL